MAHQDETVDDESKGVWRANAIAIDERGARLLLFLRRIQLAERSSKSDTE